MVRSRRCLEEPSGASGFCRPSCGCVGLAGKGGLFRSARDCYGLVGVWRESDFASDLEGRLRHPGHPQNMIATLACVGVVSRGWLRMGRFYYMSADVSIKVVCSFAEQPES